MPRWIAAGVIALSGCSGSEQDALVAPPAPFDGVGIFSADMGFRNSATTAYVGSGYVITDGSTAIGGFCPTSSHGFGFHLPYILNPNTGQIDSGSFNVSDCPGSGYWTGGLNGSQSNNESITFGPNDATNTVSNYVGRGYVHSFRYEQELTERRIELADLKAGTYAHRSGDDGLRLGYSTVDLYVSPERAIYLMSICGPGSMSLPSPGKNVIRIDIPNCRSAKPAVGYLFLDGNSVFVTVAINGANGFISGWADHQ